MKKALLTVVLLLALVSLCLGASAETAVTLTSEGAEISGEGASYKSGVLSITQDGTYVLSGEANVQIAVDAEEEVVLVLSGANLCYGVGPVIAGDVKNLILEVAEGTENTLADADDRTANADVGVSDALIYTSDDLIIRGSGSLNLTSLVGHALSCKDKLTVSDAKIVIDSANDGIHANDGFEMVSGYVSITAEGDGIQTSNNEDGKGAILLSGGTLLIKAQKKFVQAAGTFTVEGTLLTVFAK